MSDGQITLFDGTGVGLQALAVASAVAKKAEAGVFDAVMVRPAGAGKHWNRTGLISTI